MSYNQTLEELAINLGVACTDAGHKAHVVGFSLINEVLDSMQPSPQCTGVVPFNVSPLTVSLTDAAIDQLTDVLQRVVNTTFNEAVPMIKNIMEKLQQVINPDIPLAYSNYEISPVIFSSLWDTPMVMEMAEKGKNVTASVVDTAGLIKSIDAEEYSDLIALALTGLPQLDAEIRKVFGGLPAEYLKGLFTRIFFQGERLNQSPLALMTDRSEHGHSAMDEWILIVLWCNKLYEMAPKESAFSFERYRQGIVSLEQQAFSVISAVDSQRRAFSEAGRLVVNRTRTTAYVMNDLYATFLKENGSPEAVLGLLLTEQPGSTRNSTVSEIRQIQSQLETAWNRHVQITTVTHGQQMAATARRQLHLILEEVAKFHYGDESGRVPADRQGAYTATRDKVAAMIRDLPEDFTRDAHRWVFDIVGQAFYGNTDVARLLANLREVGDMKDSGLTAEEVKVLATINFTADWQADLVQFTSHGQGQGKVRSIGLENIGMGLEKITLKQGLAIAGGIALAAIVGYAAYKMFRKGSSTVEKLDKATTSAADAVEKAEETVEAVVKQEPAKRMVKCRDLYNNAGIRSRLENIPLPMLEAIAKGQDFHPDRNMHSAIKLTMYLHDTISLFDRMGSVVKAGGDDSAIVDKIIRIKDEAATGMRKAVTDLCKEVTGKPLPNVNSFDEARRKGEALAAETQERLTAQKPTEDDVKRLFDNDREIDIEKLLKVIIPARKLMRGEIKTKIANITKAFGNGDGEPPAAKDLETYRKELKERNPEQFERLEEDEEDPGHVSGFVDAILEVTAAATIFDMAALRAISGVCWAAAKLEQKNFNEFMDSKEPLKL